MGNDQVRELAQTAGEPLGRILSVTGSKAGIGLLLPSGSVPENARATVAKFVMIRSGNSVLVGIITDVSLQVSAAAREQGYQATALIDLMGEVKVGESGSAHFTRGVTRYPAIGDPAALGIRDLPAVAAADGTSLASDRLRGSPACAVGEARTNPAIKMSLRMLRLPLFDREIRSSSKFPM